MLLEIPALRGLNMATADLERGGHFLVKRREASDGGLEERKRGATAS